MRSCKVSSVKCQVKKGTILALISILHFTPYTIAFLSGCRKQPAPKAILPQSNAPNLVLETLNTSRPWELGPLLGKKTVLLCFFTTWCPYCNQSMPQLESFYERHKSQLELIGVDIHESQDTVHDFVKKHGLTFPVMLSKDSSQHENTYPVRFLPTLYLISKQGQMIRKFEGFHPTMLDEIAKSINN